jgi:hypothetical protein
MWRFTISAVNRKVYLVFFLLGLAVTALAGVLERTPGYMDAQYYAAQGQDIAQGKGFSQYFLWNYLDDPAGIPHPAFTYWMPLAALVAAGGAALGGGFATARLPFWLLSACIAPLSVYFGMRLHADPRKAILGGVFALLPVYYLAYLPTTDSFAIYMLAGGLILLIGGSVLSKRNLFILGLLAGLMHLTRADGVVWIAGVLIWTAWRQWKSETKTKLFLSRRVIINCLWVATGYLLVMGAWFVRNIRVWGWLFPPGGGKTLWLRQYEEMYLYPASQINLQSWLSSGLSPILNARLNALSTNLQTIVAVQGLIVLFAFIIVGALRYRRKGEVSLGIWMWAVTAGLMTIVFPFAGTNGSFFHSGAAFQTLFWALAPVGIEDAVRRVAGLRKWTKGDSVRRFLEIILIVCCVILSCVTYVQRVAGNRADGLDWNKGESTNKSVERMLAKFNASPDAILMINNSPGYYLTTGRKTVEIPYGREEMVLAVAKRYQVHYLVLDPETAGNLLQVYDHFQPVPGFTYLGEVGTTRLYEFTQR